MPVLYLDVLLFLNLFTDFWLLSATAKLLHIPHRRPRILGGAAIGASSSLLILLPTLPLGVRLLCELAVAAGMVRAAFRFSAFKAYAKQVGVLFLLSALWGGVAYLLWLWVAPSGFTVHNGVVYYDVSPLFLMAATLVSYGIIRLYDRVCAHRFPREQEFRVIVSHHGVSVTLRALYDTGNHLTESFSGNPVIITTEEAIQALPIPRSETVWAGKSSPAEAKAHRLRMIPFSSVGGSGVLPAFCPDRVTVCSLSGEQRVVDGAYLALTRLLGRGDYQALFGNDIAALFQKGDSA